MQNPKLTLIRNACKALAATYRRALGEAGRTLVNPDATVAIIDGLAHSVTQLLKTELGKTNLPVVMPEDPTPPGPHWLIEPLGSRINALHGRLPVSANLAYIDDKGTCPLGAVYFPIEDVLVFAEKGTGATGPERLRVAGRATLEDAVLLLPRLNQSAIDLNLLPLALQHKLHPRKSGHSLFDAIDVAAGRADILVATHLTRLESLLATLILSESGVHVTDLQGNRPDVTTTTLLAANLKLHPLILAALTA